MASETKSKKAADGNKFMTPVFRVSFPNVFQARAAVTGSEPKFNIAMIFPKNISDAGEKAKLEAIKAATRAAAVEKWGADTAKWPKLRSPWRDGAEKDYDGYGPDVIFATASSKIKPGLVDAGMNEIIAPNEFYGGCYARATITVYAYDNVSKGVAFGLRNVQKVRDGEPFAGASKPEDDFDAITPPSGAANGAAAADPLGAGAAAGNGMGI